MKILHLTTHLNRGGISNYILSVGSALRAKGHQLFVGSDGGEMEEEFREQGFHLKNFPIRTKSELHPKIYAALPSLIHWIREEQIELIHAHTRITQVMADWIQRVSQTPYLTTAHGFYKRRLGRRFLPAWGKRVVAISDPVGDYLLDVFKVPGRNLRVIYNGLDLESFANAFRRHDPQGVRREYGFNERAYVIGITARLVPEKGHEYLIRTAKSLETEIPDLKILIVGDGRYRSQLEALTQKFGLSERVRFLGNLRDVSKPLAAMDVFTLPAVWREGFGLSVAEAMACGKPIIATNIWALNALIENRVNGILVEPRSVSALAEAILFIYKNKTFRESIAEAGRKTAAERFSMDRMVRELETVYEEVLQG